MKSALIGYTGFVGSILCEQFQFDDFYNSKNIEDIQGKTYDLVVCAGAPAEKWKANKDPETDLRTISRLLSCFESVQTKSFVVISTVDVYKIPILVDENTLIDKDCLSPYGKHRFILENYFRAKFKTTIIRLPGLYGRGLKKNIIFDFLHNNNLSAVHQDGVFQFYNLSWLWKDIQKVLENNISLINFSTEPTSVSEIVLCGFGIDFKNNLTTTPAKYNVRSIHAKLWSGEGGYLYMKEKVLHDLSPFVSSEKAKIMVG